MGGVFLSTNNGSNWTPVNDGLTRPYVLALAVSGTNLFAGTSGGGIFLSTNNGSSWTSVNNGLTNKYVQSLTVIDTNIFAGTSGSGLFLSTNNGLDWTEINQDLNVLSIAISGTNIFIGSKGSGVWVRPLTEIIVPVELISFLAEVKGASVILNWNTATETNNNGFEVERKSENYDWQKIVFLKGNGTTTELKSYYYIDKNLSAGKYSYRLKQIDLDGSFQYSNIIDVEVGVPNEFSLSQNYPNPFNPVTKINYSIPTTSFVTLKVYDVLGTEITTLVNEVQPAGYKEVKFNASSLSSGVYIYRLSVENYISTKKMMVVK